MSTIDLSRSRTTSYALIALVLGAIAVGASPIFVRLSELGPFATAFWRVALALPLLWVWAVADKQPLGSPLDLSIWAWAVPAGLLFAGDLFFWHLSILNTTVANATLFANSAPVLVALGAWFFLGERITQHFVVGLVLSIVGSVVVVGASFQLDPANVLGDGYGVATAVFFSSYILFVRSIRNRISVARLMFWSGLVMAGALLLVTLISGETVFPATMRGWAVLIGLAWISQLAGLSLVSYGIGHLPAAFSSLVILIEPVAAAILGWMILTEPLGPLQLLGAIIILAGVIIARPKSV